MKILFLTDYLPYPPMSGDRLRVYNLVRRLGERHEVSLIALLWAPDDIVGVSHMRQFCRRVETAAFRWRSPLANVGGMIRNGLSGKPPQLHALSDNGLMRRIGELAAAEDFDVIHIEQSRMAPYIEALPPGARCARVLGFQNIAAQQFSLIARVERDFKARLRALTYGLMMRRWEPRYAERFDGCLTVSEPDRRTLMAANPALRIEVIPNGVDTRAYQPLSPAEAPPALLFIGSMSYAPCVDGAVYLTRQVLPRIRQAAGPVELWIVGADPSPEVTALIGEGIHVTGRVESVIPYYRRSAVTVVPLRAGGGTRLKILEAMALGRPVVSTSLGCEGLDVIDGENILIADTPEGFGERVVRLLKDRDLYARLSTSARELVVDRYDWDGIAGKLLDVYSGLIGGRRPAEETLGTTVR